MVVGRGGRHVHSCTQRTRRDGWFEVLAAQGMQPNQQVTFLTANFLTANAPAISTSFVESAVNQVIGKRMVKQPPTIFPLSSEGAGGGAGYGRPVGQGQFRHAGKRLCTSVYG